MASFKTLFRPKGGKFYDLFESAAENIIEMSRLFQQLSYNKSASIPADILAKIEDLEHKNDEITHQVFIHLGRNFLTPFDREDIHSLTSALDDIADFTWGAARQLKNQQLIIPGDTTTVFASQHHTNMKKLAEAIRELRDTKSFSHLRLLLRDLHQSTQKTSVIVDDALINVYADGKELKDAIKRIDHYELLHGILEKTALAVRTMEIIVVKYE